MSAIHTLELDQDPRVIVGSRVLDAPRDLVWRVWTDPTHLAQWWGPNGFRTTTSAYDLRPGGVWRFVMHGPDGRDYQNTITYFEIVRPERLVYSHGGGDEDLEPVSFHTTVTFVPKDKKTLVTLRAIFPTAAERERVIREHGALEGGKQTLERLDEHLASLASGRSSKMDSRV
jgi:uncharacterized protein YndB with AHSA1/START domain